MLRNENGGELAAFDETLGHERGLDDGYCLLYRPPAGPAFCFEPVTHPIDAFHQPGQPGLRVLHTGESLSLQVQWRFHTTG